MRFLLLFLFSSSLLVSESQFQTNYDDAIKLAKKENKHLLMVFSGSDWCKPCIKLHRKVLTDSTFQSFADSTLVLLKLDFPYQKRNQLPKDQKEHNAKLADKYNSEGQFPKVILMDSAGSIVSEIKYKKSTSPTSFISDIKTKF